VSGKGEKKHKERVSGPESAKSKKSKYKRDLEASFLTLLKSRFVFERFICVNVVDGAAHSQ
jgi:hypothetical protein